MPTPPSCGPPGSPGPTPSDPAVVTSPSGTSVTTPVAAPRACRTTTATTPSGATAAPSATAPMAGPGSVPFDLNFDLFVQLLNRNQLHKDSQYHGVPLLHYAAFHARKDIVRELLHRGALMTILPGRHLSPLHFACNKDRKLCSDQEVNDRADIVRMLVSNAVQLDVQESRGWTALKFAVRNGLVNCVQALIDCNANADLPDEDGYTPLHNAVVVAKDMHGEDGFQMLGMLLRRARNVNAVNDRRHTPLLLALLQRDRRSAESLLHYGADPNAMDADGNTPLILASQIGDSDLVAVLLSRGAHVNLVSSCRQRTALHYAVETGGENIVRFLLRHSADAYIRDNNGDTPLSLASGRLLDLIRACAAVQATESGDADRLGELYRDGLDINAIHLASKSPLLHHAACAGQPDVVQFLLRNGAFVNDPNSEGNTSLHYACVSELPHRNYAETLRQLLDSGADINAQNKRGDTPLHLAAERGFNLRVSMLLKKAGAHQLIANHRGELALHKACCNNQALMSVFILLEGLQATCLNRPCSGGWTPLMFACRSHAMDIVNYLLDECKADVNIRQNEGYTALHIAVQSRRPDTRLQLCSKLIQHNADPTIQAGSKKLTPLHYVCAKGVEDIALLLAENGGDLLKPDAEGDSAMSMLPRSTSEEFRHKLQGFIKDCPDAALVTSWTCTLPCDSSSHATATATAPGDEHRYDALPSHEDLIAQASIPGRVGSVGSASGTATAAADTSDGDSRGVDVPRTHLKQTARQVARRLFRLQQNSASGIGADDSSGHASDAAADDRASPGLHDCVSMDVATDGGGEVRYRSGEASSNSATRSKSLKSRQPAADTPVTFSSLSGTSVLYSNVSSRSVGQDKDSDIRTTIKGNLDVSYARIGGSLVRGEGDDDTLRMDAERANQNGLMDSTDAIRHLFLGMRTLSKQITVDELGNEEDDVNMSFPPSAGLVQIPLADLSRDTDLGSGSYSDVYRSVYQDQPVAVKLFRNMTGDEVKRIFQQEVLMLSKMSHPNVLKIIGYCHDSDGHAIVTDLLERGSLQDVLHDKQLDLPWPLRLQMLQHTALGMQYLHKCQLLHRDLKSGNLLVGANFNVQVADFGMTKVRQHTVTMTTSFRGTPAYIAPETFDTKSHSEASDVYAFGIILYEVASRKSPYHENRHMRLMELMMSVLRGSRPTLDTDTMAAQGQPPVEYVDLMQQCWHEDFRQRPNFTEIIATIRRMLAAAS